MEKLKVAVIGLGRVSVMHLRSIMMLSDMCELVAVCDIKEDRARAVSLEYGVRYYTDYEKLLDYERLDAVHIALPHYLHSKVAVAAFDKGVHVLCEKPMDIDYETALGAVMRAEERGVLYGIVSQCRYNNATRAVKERVESGKLGRVLTATSNLTWSRSDEYYSASDWKGTWDKEGGGVLIDQAIHSVDLVNWIIGTKPVDVSCFMANRGHKRVDVEDTCEAFITYECGARYGMYAMNNFGFDEPIEIKLCCERGRVRMSYDDAYIEYSDGTREEIHKEAASPVIEGGKTYWGVRHVKQIRQFYLACLGKEPLEISGREALKTHSLVMKMYELGGMRK